MQEYFVHCPDMINIVEPFQPITKLPPMSMQSQCFSTVAPIPLLYIPAYPDQLIIAHKNLFSVNTSMAIDIRLDNFLL